MTDLQKRFCEEYVIDYHISDAGKRAGYQGDNVRITCWQVLQLPEIQEYIELLQLEASKRCQISKDELLMEFKKVGFSNIKNYMTDDFEAKTLSEVKDPEAIRSIKKTIVEGPVDVKTTIEFTLHDKISGLVNIGRHIGFFKEDNNQKSNTIQIMNLDPLSDATTDDSTTEDI